ncbi:MAG: hypothetical protein F6K03_02600 [Kamptonema sp. SIO4C4]|nr:hypothetical protein [Kamptonema sp. SIO4C4]
MPMFPWEIFALFSFLGLVGILNHAMWRDELNVWLIVRDSVSWQDLIANIKYEGHPALWYFCLAVLNQLTDAPIVMKLLHFCIAVGSAFLFLFYSPFSRLKKILFIFGYLPFYEYFLISRNYAFSLLFVFAFCALFKSRKRSYLGLASALFFLANSNAYGLLLSFALFMTLVADYCWQKKSLASVNYPKLADILTSIGVYGAGLFLSLWMIIPPLDSQLKGGLTQWFLAWDFHHLMKVLSRLWSSYILLLIPGDSHVLGVTFFGLFSVIIFLGFISVLLRKPIPLLFYVLGTLELWAFTYTKFLGSPRHYGYLFIVLIVALWLSFYYPSNHFLPQQLYLRTQKHFPTVWRFYQWSCQRKNTVILIILIAQLISGITAFGRDLIVPFSAGRATAAYLKQENLDQMFLVGSEDFAMATISGYLNKKIYYPETQQLGSFVLFDLQRQQKINWEVIAEVRSLLNRPDLSEVLLIVNYELKIEPRLNVEAIAQFTHSFIHNEKYYLYRVTKSSGVERTPELN